MKAQRVAIGDLRDRVTLQEAVATDDGMGGQSITKWKPIGDVWAAVSMGGGSERLQGEQITASASVSVQTRWRSDISTAHRLIWRDRTLQIHGVLEDSHKRSLTLTCSEVQA